MSRRKRLDDIACSRQRRLTDQRVKVVDSEVEGESHLVVVCVLEMICVANREQGGQRYKETLYNG